MKRLDTLFIVHRAKSSLLSQYDPGDVPYVRNGLSDNGVRALVTPLKTDRVFTFRAIVVSAFCEATVQVPPFIACSRSGNGLVVLEPRVPMTIAEMAYYAAYLNTSVQWRFSWYRKITADRMKRIMLPDAISDQAVFDVSQHIPPTVEGSRDLPSMQFQPFALGALYTLKPGDYHRLTVLPKGQIPVVSCGDTNNGVCGYFAVSPDHIYRDKMTIAFNGSTLAAKYHPYDFAAKDDVAICFPRQPLRLTTELFIQVMVEQERWRFSYYRKCYRQKLEQTTIQMPVKQGQLDEEGMQEVIQGTPYWEFLKKHLGRENGVANEAKG